jgi:hypothetical protein
VAVKACAHRKLIYLRENVHILYGSMAVRTSDTFVHVNAVIEVRVIWYSVDSFPRKRNTLLIVFCQLDDLRPCFPGNGMAIHANRDSGDCGMRRS